MEEIKYISAKNSYLDSCDIKSLFTSTTFKEVIKIFADYFNSVENPIFRKDTFVRLLHIATQKVGITNSGKKIHVTLFNNV